MRKTFLVFLIAFLKCSLITLGQSFCTDSVKIKFPGVAPAPWAINGNINDWETILGPATGNPLFPFTPSPTSSFNYFNETSDLDQPAPSKDLRFLAFTHDDYNVYFYLRRLDNANGQNSFFYFCDINADGLMKSGEPVFFASFNSKNISSLSIGSYNPNTSIDFISSPFLGEGNYMVSPPNDQLPLSDCHADGYSIKGTINELFNSSAIPDISSLAQNEIFAAALTEDGFGVEFAIPWRYLKNWVTNSMPLNPIQHRDIFTYHVSLMSSGGKYQPIKVSDNVGGCDHVYGGLSQLAFIHDLGLSGNPDFQLTNMSKTTLIPGSSYRLKLTYQNITNVSEKFSFNELKFKNIQSSLGSVPDIQNFSVNVHFDDNCNGITDEPPNNFSPYSMLYESGDINQEPVVYRSTESRGINVPSLQLICIILDIAFPTNGSVQSCQIEIQPKTFFNILLECFPSFASADGGKPINPIGFDLGLDEPEVTRSKQYQISSETLNDFGNKIRIYPNPSSGNTNVLLPLELKDAVITLSDYSGKIIRKLITSGQRLVRLENLKAGFYILHVRSKDARMQSTKKLIVQ